MMFFCWEWRQFDQDFETFCIVPDTFGLKLARSNEFVIKQALTAAISKKNMKICFLDTESPWQWRRGTLRDVAERRATSRNVAQTSRKTSRKTSRNVAHFCRRPFFSFLFEKRWFSQESPAQRPQKVDTTKYRSISHKIFGFFQLIFRIKTSEVSKPATQTPSQARENW